MSINTKIRHLYNVISRRQILDFIAHKIDRLYVVSESDLIAKQHSRLVKILKYANEHCPHYRELGIDVKKWEDIYKYPLLSKVEIKSNPKAFLSDKIDRLESYIGHTGGSTGEPLEVYNSPGIDDLFQIKLWKRNGYVEGDIILAMDGAKVDDKAIEAGQYLYKKNNTQLPYGGYGLSSLYVTDFNLSEYVRELINLRPTFIRGYPSFVYRVAKYISDQKIDITFKMKAVELTSESSFPFQHELIKAVFGCPVILQYGHTESCVFGYTYDDSMKYRIEPLYGYVEVIKEDGNHADVGEIGEVIVTTLHNNAMPLIRYKTGDNAVYGGADANGIILNEILGRTQDYIIDRDGNKKLLTALIFAQHFNALGNMVQWQLEQYTAGKIIAHIIKHNNYSSKDEEEIRKLFDKTGNVDMIFDYVSEIPLTGRGKSKMLVQHCNL